MTEEEKIAAGVLLSLIHIFLSENSLLQGFGELTLPTRPGSDFSELTGTRERCV